MNITSGPDSKGPESIDHLVDLERTFALRPTLRAKAERELDRELDMRGSSLAMLKQALGSSVTAFSDQEKLRLAKLAKRWHSAFVFEERVTDEASKTKYKKEQADALEAILEILEQ